MPALDEMAACTPAFGDILAVGRIRSPAQEVGADGRIVASAVCVRADRSQNPLPTSTFRRFPSDFLAREKIAVMVMVRVRARPLRRERDIYTELVFAP